MSDVTDGPTDSPSSPRERVLVVEDDEMTRLLVTEAIKGARREIRTAETVAGAREALADQAFDVVILDLILPDGDGRQLLARIRERPRSALVPVVILSARGGRASQLECFRLGADEFFEKPFDPEIVGAAVDRQLERSRGTAPVTRTVEAGGHLDRAGLVERYGDLLDRERRGERPLSVAHLQVDGFPELDPEDRRRTMTALFDSLARTLDSTDSTGRWEDGEIVVLLPDRDTPTAHSVVIEALDRWEDLHDTPVAASVSAGVAGPPQPDTLRSAVIRADRALLGFGRGHDDRVGVAGGGRRDASTTEPPGGSETESSEGTSSPEGISPRILVVEDDEMTTALIRHRFEREGMHIHHESRGRDALALLSDGDPADFDLVMLDVKIPGVGGFELLQEIRSRPAWSEVPVMMLTGMGRDEDVVRAFDLGADDYVLKPFSPVEVVARVQRLLRRR